MKNSDYKTTTNANKDSGGVGVREVGGGSINSKSTTFFVESPQHFLSDMPGRGRATSKGKAKAKPDQHQDQQQHDGPDS